MKPYIGLCAVLLALLLCWGGALSRAQWLKYEYIGVSVRLVEGVSGEALTAALTESGQAAPKLCAWTRGERDITIENGMLGSQAQVRRIAVYGDMAEVCPMTVICGALPVSADEYGCVIDEATAAGLFHNLEVTGAAIALDGKNYTVRAVVRAREPMLLLRDGGSEYENLELTFADIQRAGAGTEEFLNLLGGADGHTVVENGFYAAFAAGLALLPALLAAGVIVGALLVAAWKRRTIPIQLALLLAGTAAAVVLLRWLLKLELFWPDRFLPTRWSDFEFWPKLFEAQKSYFDRLGFLLPVPKDMLWAQAIRALLLCVAGASLSMLLLLTWGRSPVRRLPFGSLICVLGCLAAATGILHICGAHFIPTAGYLYAVPVWWLFESRDAFIKALRGMLTARLA